MLSYIYRVAMQFERKHGMRPNLLYLSYEHFEELKKSVADPADISVILNCLEMELILGREIVHPHVGWSPVRAKAV